MYSVKLKVNSVTSIQEEYLIEYYHLPYCEPADGIKKDHENLGEFLSGDRIENSPYEIKMKTDMFCETVCVVDLDVTEKKTKRLEKAIKSGYHNNWIVDNLPSASKMEDEKNTYTNFSHGFPVGFKDPKSEDLYLNNHVNIELEYHAVEASLTTEEEPSYRIVRFTVEPFSVKHSFKGEGDVQRYRLTLSSTHQWPGSFRSYPLSNSRCLKCFL